MLHFYLSPKGDYVNFRQMTSFIVSHDMSWVVDESGQRYKIGGPDDIPCFISFLNLAIETEEQIVSHEVFAIFRQDMKDDAGEPTTHEELDNPPGVGIQEGDPVTRGESSVFVPTVEGTPPPASPPPKSMAEEFDKAKPKDESDLMYPPDKGDGAKDISGDQPPPKKGGKKN